MTSVEEPDRNLRAAIKHIEEITAFWGHDPSDVVWYTAGSDSLEQLDLEILSRLEYFARLTQEDPDKADAVLYDVWHKRTAAPGAELRLTLDDVEQAIGMFEQQDESLSAEDGQVPSKSALVLDSTPRGENPLFTQHGRVPSPEPSASNRSSTQVQGVKAKSYKQLLDEIIYAYEVLLANNLEAETVLRAKLKELKPELLEVTKRSASQEEHESKPQAEKQRIDLLQDQGSPATDTHEEAFLSVDSISPRSRLPPSSTQQRPDSIQSPILLAQTGINYLQNPSSEMNVALISEHSNSSEDKARRLVLLGRRLQLVELTQHFWMYKAKAAKSTMNDDEYGTQYWDCRANMVAARKKRLSLQHQIDDLHNDLEEL